jgi:hypothetical protein
MLHPYELIHGVLDSNRSLAVKLARITNKSDTYFRAQGYEPKTSNPLMQGVNSPVADYMAFCELYEAAEPSCGRMLNDRVHNELANRFAEKDLFTTTQSDLQISIIDEAGDVQKWLAKFNIDIATSKELAAFDNECNEAIGAIMDAQSRARARFRMVQMSRSNGYATNGAK